MFTENKKNLLYYLMLGSIIVIADRITKSWALTLVQEKVINPFLSFGLTFNRGINWGFLNSPDNSFLFIVINIAIAIVVIGMAAFTVYCWRHHYPILGNILILAGAVSNYFDRIYYGGVIDFIILSAGNWSWPAFNIADAVILAGVGIVLITSFKER